MKSAKKTILKAKIRLKLQEIILLNYLAERLLSKLSKRKGLFIFMDEKILQKKTELQKLVEAFIFCGEMPSKETEPFIRQQPINF